MYILYHSEGQGRLSLDSYGESGRGGGGACKSRRAGADSGGAGDYAVRTGFIWKKELVRTSEKAGGNTGYLLDSAVILLP